MASSTHETKLENLRIRSQAKAKVSKVVSAIQKRRGIKPTLTEAVTLMADHYLATGPDAADQAKARAQEVPAH